MTTAAATKPTVTRTLPARCEAEWILLPAAPGEIGTADLNGEEYQVQSIIDKGRRVGVRFTSPRGDIRDVDLTVKPVECDCEDHQVRRKGKDPDGCKHCQAVRQLDNEARVIRANETAKPKETPKVDRIPHPLPHPAPAPVHTPAPELPDDDGLPTMSYRDLELECQQLRQENARLRADAAAKAEATRKMYADGRFASETI